MHLVLVTALIAVCGADKLDRRYLPPASANTAGGSPGSLQAPFRSFNQGLGGLPKGGYSNEFEGVVVDAAASGTRASGAETGLGGPRIAYGSTNSKVGDAAFTADTAFPRVGIHAGLPGSDIGAHSLKPERVQASRDRTSNTVKYENDVNPDSFNYAFETDNGIIAEENGVEVNGVKAQGGYSYTGDDGQVYSVTYTADAGGYQPKGDHLPTPPPIPQEILKSLEQNAKDEASGVVDDGSYDAQKYNTGDDYENGDGSNGKYNAGRPTRLGNRPQADADASGTFINQNNQVFGTSSSIQFGSTPVSSASAVVTGAFGPSIHGPSNGNNFGVSASAHKTTQNGQIGFGTGSSNEYLPPHSGFNQNRRPALNTRPQVQSNQQNGLLQGTVSSGVNNNGDASKDQSSQIPTFVPLSQQKLQQDSPKKPSTPIFGKPTVIDSSLSIKDPFARRPSGNRFTQNKQPNQKTGNGQVGGSFEVVSGNIYSKNEYLPPHRQSNKNKGSQGFQVSSSATQSNQQPTGSKSETFTAGPNSPSTSAFASVSRPTSGFQSSQYNSQQRPQYTGSGLSSQLSQTGNSRLPLNNPPHLGIGLPNAPVSQSQYKPSSLSFASQSPTSVPQTVLTTPLESSLDNNKGSIPTPVIDGPDSPKDTTSSNLPSFGARPSSNIFGHTSFNSNRVQQVAPTQASAIGSSPLNGQSSSPGLQNVPQAGIALGSFGAQFPNKSPIDVQYSPSTQRPSFTQNTQQQGADDSYFYNTPSKPFNVPTARPHISSFPGTSFDQPFKVTQTPFGTRPQPSSFQTSFTSQYNRPVGSTGFPSLSTLEPMSPTLTTLLAGQNGDAFQSQFNKVTQASASSFPSPVPTASADFHRNQFGQFGTRPSQGGNSQFKQDTQGSTLFKQPGSSFAQATASIQPSASGQDSNQRLPGTSKLDSVPNQSSESQQTQQYGGELYEYKKPPQSLPAPQTGVTSGQFGSSSFIPQTSSQNSAAYKPSTQFGSKFTQQTVSPFGQTPQNSQQHSQSEARPGLFGSVSSKPTQNTQLGQGNYGFNSNTQNTQSVNEPGIFGSQPSYTTQDSQGNQAFNSKGQSQDQPQTELTSGQFGSQFSKPNQASGASHGNQQFSFNEENQAQSQNKPGSFGSGPKPQGSQLVQGASKFPPDYNKPGPACCSQSGSPSSQADQPNRTPQFGGQNEANTGFGQKEPASQDTRPVESISSFPGVGENFGGPRKPPSFDATGYHY
ncbi:uncharacterized protein [Epargyreus clarus]|uniref:uncharacterized protein n=1 Tax=Epargyreus clarus TaxID=520877 RepID=UPI003C306E73